MGGRAADHPPAGWTDGRATAEGVDSGVVGLRGRPSGKRAFTRPPHPEAMQLDDPPTPPRVKTPRAAADQMPPAGGDAGV